MEFGWFWIFRHFKFLCWDSKDSNSCQVLTKTERSLGTKLPEKQHFVICQHACVFLYRTPSQVWEPFTRSPARYETLVYCSNLSQSLDSKQSVGAVWHKCHLAGVLMPLFPPFCWPVQLQCPESRDALENQPWSGQLTPQPAARGAAQRAVEQGHLAVTAYHYSLRGGSLGFLFKRFQFIKNWQWKKQSSPLLYRVLRAPSLRF